MSEEELKAKAVQEFVNLMIGAFEAGFTDRTAFTLAELHRVMQNHCKDAYQVDLPHIAEEWGEEVAKECGFNGVLL